MRSNLILVLLVSSLGLGAVMCSSSDDDGAGTQTAGNLASGRFRGVLSGAGDVSGVVDLTATPAGTTTSSVRPRADSASSYTLSGTVNLNVPGVGPIAVTGSLDLASNTATFSGTALGGAATFTGTYAAGVIRGTATLPTGQASFQLSNETLGVKAYCGTFSGELSGRWSMLTAGNQAGVVFATGAGQVGRGLGTVDGTLVTIPLEPNGSATGNVSTGAISGTYLFDEKRGAFAASEGACAALTPAGTLPDGGVLVDGGGTPEGGTPGTPQDVYDVGGTTNVSFLALGGGKVFYAIDYPYFSSKVTIGSVNADGTSPALVIPTNDPLATPKSVVGGLTATDARVFYIAGTDSPGGAAKLLSVAYAGGAVSDHGSFGDASNLDYIPGVSRLVNDGAAIFLSWWSPSNRGVKRYTTAGVGGEVVAGLNGPAGVGLDGTDVFFGDVGDTNTSALKRVAKPLTAIPASFAGGTEYGGPLAIPVNFAFDATNVYFTTNTTTSSTIWRKPKAGGTIAAVLASVPSRVRGLALLDGYLYFSASPFSGGQAGVASGTLQRVAASATNAAGTTIGAANGYDVLTDGTYVYWGNAKKIQRLHK